MTFTKVQLIERCEEAIVSLKPCTGLAETKSLACFEIALSALAGMEAVPVAWRWNYGGKTNWRLQDVKPSDGNNNKCHRVIQPLYTAPQPLTTSERAELENYRNAQQVVPGEYPDDSESVCIALERCRTRNGAFQRYKLGWDDCRAAMLQGADGNSPVIPDGWVACSERMPSDFETVLVCQDGGVIFCAEYEDGDFYPDEFPNVPKQGCEITHWMPMPAAPQQEVKP